MKQAYFVTGTDTGVGKTLIASALVHQFAQQGLKSVGMKPVAAGCELVGRKLVNEDVTQLIAASNMQAPPNLVNPYAFTPPIAPHIAAQQASEAISLDVIAEAFVQLAAVADVVIVEGAGGFCVPLNDIATMADLAVKLDIPVLLVVGLRLGCINHALLTVEAIQARGLKLAGWIANQLDPEMAVFEENIASLKLRIHSPYLGLVSWNDEPRYQHVPTLTVNLFD
jgi:dethiobiotin synthetase